MAEPQNPQNPQQPPRPAGALPPTQPASPRPAGTAPAQPGQPTVPRPAGTAPAQPGQPTVPRPAGTAPAQPAQPGAARPAGTAPAQPGQPATPRPAGTASAQPGQPTAPRPAGTAPAQPGQPNAPRSAGTAPAQPGQPGAARPVAPGPKPPVPQGIKPPAPAAPGAPGAPRPAQPAVPGAKPVAPGARPAAPQGIKPVAPGPKPAAPQGAKIPAQKSVDLAPTRAEAVAERGKRKLGQVLIDLGFIDEDQLWELLEEAKQEGKQIGQAVVDRGLINADQLLQALSEQHSLKLANLSESKPSPEALAIVPETMANIYKIMPLAFKDRILTIVVSDPANASAADDLRNLLSLNEVQVQLASAEAMSEAIAKAYNTTKEESIIDVIKELETSGQWQGGGRESSIDLESALEMADSAPVRKLINMIFLMGIRDRASDIHFEPFEEEYRVRMKADGVLYELVPPPRHLATAISSRIKVMSNLDITERRLPQDGRIELNVGGNQVDMRVSVLPTLFGESIVIRILDRTSVKLDLDKIGMAPEVLEPFKEVIEKPNGIILVTGPTGSGKTTTLYSALSYLNHVEDKIITTEDPVEYEIEGLVQCPINHEIGLTFASALRAILRQDPDRILVGEIRDLETAQIAVQASLTGHTVFSTLHTNDAPSTITRMRDMGLEPFLITATVEAVLAQRLVRTICQNCKEEFRPSAEMLVELNLTPQQVEGKPFFFGRGCDKCNNTGYKGRMGLHELIIVDDDIRDAISGSLSTDDLRVVCERKGMISLRESGMRAIHKGKTTIDEVVRETVLESN